MATLQPSAANFCATRAPNPLTLVSPGHSGQGPGTYREPPVIRALRSRREYDMVVRSPTQDTIQYERERNATGENRSIVKASNSSGVIGVQRARVWRRVRRLPDVLSSPTISKVVVAELDLPPTATLATR